MADTIVVARGGVIQGIFANSRRNRVVVIDCDEIEEGAKKGAVWSQLPRLRDLPQDSHAIYKRTVRARSTRRLAGRSC